MKRQDRKVWSALADLLPDGDLCLWCRYQECYGACEDGISECKHPLWKVQDHSEDVPVMDCWGFRPIRWLTVSDAADIVGTALANNWDAFQFINTDDGQILVSGRNSRKVEAIA